jgi:hypothetical protein
VLKELLAWHSSVKVALVTAQKVATYFLTSRLATFSRAKERKATFDQAPGRRCADDGRSSLPVSIVGGEINGRQDDMHHDKKTTISSWHQ